MNKFQYQIHDHHKFYFQNITGINLTNIPHALQFLGTKMSILISYCAPGAWIYATGEITLFQGKIWSLFAYLTARVEVSEIFDTRELVLSSNRKLHLPHMETVFTLTYERICRNSLVFNWGNYRRALWICHFVLTFAWKLFDM